MEHIMNFFHAKELKNEKVDFIDATTWDGKDIIHVWFPKKLTLSEAKEIGSYLLNELDDHDAFDKFLTKLPEGSQQDYIDNFTGGD
jgi:hypothetical protein